MRLLVLVLGLISVCAQPDTANSAEPALTEPAQGLTNGDAIMVFGGALMDCLQSREGGRSIQELGSGAALKVKPATASDRKWAPPQTPPEAPVWVTDKLGYQLEIAEPSRTRCEVLATGLPVDRTFQSVIFAFSQALPEFKPVHVDPGYDPIVYQLESVTGGTRYIIHMEGAEPGTPLHAMRFSLLYAYVLRQPAGEDQPNTTSEPKTH
jgi:hypothetical protein